MTTYKNRFHTNISKRQLAKTFRQAAKNIETFGLHKGTFGCEDTGYCVLGSMRLLTDVSVFDQPYLALSAYHRTYMNGNGDVVGFNDDPSTTKEDILGLLRGAARALEHGLSY